MRKVLIYGFSTVLFLFALAAGIWAYGVPDSYVTERIMRGVPSPLNVRIEGFRKTILLGFSADTVMLGIRGANMIRITGISGGLVPLSLLKGRLDFRFEGRSYGGVVGGTVSLRRGGAEGTVLIDGVDLSGVEALAGAGIPLKGIFSGDAAFASGIGSAQFTVHNLSAGVMSFAGIPVPLQYFHSVRGAIEMPGRGAVSIKALSLEGEGIYLRATGEFARGAGDITIEIMPEASFPDKAALMLLDRYKVSEGYYRVPVRFSLRNLLGSLPEGNRVKTVCTSRAQGPVLA